MAVKSRKEEESILKKLKQTQIIKSEGLDRFSYDSKRVEKFGSIVE